MAPRLPDEPAGRRARWNAEVGPDTGLYETLVTTRIAQLLEKLTDERLEAQVSDLANAESADRVSRHVARLVARAIEAVPEHKRADEAVRIAVELLNELRRHVGDRLGLDGERPLEPGRVLQAILQRRPDGTSEHVERPLTPLLDTTVLTNAPGEPAVAHEIRAEIPSADAVDILMAFIRWSGVRNLVDVLGRHRQAEKPLRVLTTTYTNSTEQRALDELAALGADIRISYDSSLNRPHAKAWLFQRRSSYSTAYLGSSNLTYSAQVTGLEWNVRLSQARNPDAVEKMAAVFESYWASPEFVPYDPDEFRHRVEHAVEREELVLSPVEVVLRPFQEELLDRVALARHQGHHRNLLVAATGTDKTVMAAVDYAKLRSELIRARLLFVAHREEILDQSRNTFRQALRDAAFGEKWVGGSRPERFDHVFASIQSLNASGIELIDPERLPTMSTGPDEVALLRSIGRLLHIDDEERLSAYRHFLTTTEPPNPQGLGQRRRRLLRMLVTSLTTLRISAPLEAGLDQIWGVPQVRAELVELFDLLAGRIEFLSQPLPLDPTVPIRAHARYSRLEILAAFGARPQNWQSGVLHVPEAKADLFAFTLDKSSRGFSPTTRYRDYAVNRSLIHWESQSVTSVASPTGQRYINHETFGSSVVLFARLRADDRAFWCLGTARYRSHQGERPIAFVWELDIPLPAELHTAFAAAVA